MWSQFVTTSDVEPQALQVRANGALELCGFLKLAGERGGEALHFLFEGFAVVFGVFRADVSARGKDKAVGRDFFGGSGFAEAGDVGVGRSMLRPYRGAPRMIRARDAGDFFFGELAVLAIHERAHFAGVNEEGLASAVSEQFLVRRTRRRPAVPFIPGQEPQADGNLGDVKQLARKSDHAVHEVGFDDGFTDFAFAGLIGGHRAIGENESGDAIGRKVVNEVLDPGEIGVAGGRNAEFPARVFFEAFAAPIAVVERRIGEDEIGFEVLVGVVVKGTFAVPGDIGLDAADGEVHFAEAPGGLVGFLAVDAEVGAAAAVGFDEFFGLDEHAAGAAARVIDAAFVRLDHFDEELDDGLRGVEFATLFAFGGSELAEEVFVHAAKNILGAAFLVSEADGADEIDEFAEAALIEGLASVVLGKHALEAGIFLFNGEHGVVEELADAGLAAACSLSQRAALGTQKTFSAAYSSRSSGSAWGSAARTAWRSSKASEMYLRKIRPRTTCL